MNMKKILTMLFALLFAFTMQAQNIKLTLNNGQTVSGNTKSLFMYDNGSEIRVKDKKNGEHKDYKSSEIKEVKYFDEKGKEWITFVPLMAQKNYAERLGQKSKTIQRTSIYDSFI